MQQVVATFYRIRTLALQPLSAENSAEFSQADNPKTIQPREINHWIPQIPLNRFIYNSNPNIGRNMN